MKYFYASGAVVGAVNVVKSKARWSLSSRAFQTRMGVNVK